jgi:mannose/fructose/N-acetylgalactosamine-specific phosphotransferase system component IIC
MWAGLFSLDVTGFGPWMMSQPMVVGPLFGWAMGQLRVGVIIGGIVQMIWMDVTPVGVGIPFDAMAVTQSAIYIACLTPNCPVPMMMMALIAAAPLGYLFCLMDSYARRLNTWGVRRLESVPDAYLPWALDAGIAGGLLWSWVRYGAFYALVFYGGQKVWALSLQWLMPNWVLQGLTFAADLLPIAGLGVALELFLTEEPERRYSALRVFKRG